MEAYFLVIFFQQLIIFMKSLSELKLLSFIFRNIFVFLTD